MAELMCLATRAIVYKNKRSARLSFNSISRSFGTRNRAENSANARRDKGNKGAKVMDALGLE